VKVRSKLQENGVGKQIFPTGKNFIPFIEAKKGSRVRITGKGCKETDFSPPRGKILEKPHPTERRQKGK
jgi:hypothetical protein